MEYSKKIFFCCVLFKTIIVQSDTKLVYSDMFHFEKTKFTSSDSSRESLDLLIQQIDEIAVKFSSRTTKFEKLPWENFIRSFSVTSDTDQQSFSFRSSSDGQILVQATLSNTRTITNTNVTDLTTVQTNFTEIISVPPEVTTEPHATVSTPVPLEVTELCINQTEALISGISERQQWSLRMLDAMGKPGSNILGAIPVVTWVGDYDECVAIENKTVFNGIPYNIKGKYCSATMTVGIALLYIGFCLPNGCSDIDSTNLIKSVSSKVVSVTCQDPDIPLDTRATIVIVVLCVFMVLIVIGTIYDVLVVQRPSRSKIGDTEPIIHNGENEPLINTRKVNSSEPGIAGKLVLSFSLYTNISKILSTQQGAGTLTSINGIRFITMTWVILGHTLIFAIQYNSVDNSTQWLQDRLSRISFGPIYNAFPAVDTFFALSGLLLTYLVMKELKSKDGRMNWLMFYFHRFWRLTPPYMLILVTYVSLFPYIGKGPIWQRDGPEVNYCKHSWHRNILYVNNLFVEGYDMCMGWSWYLANDMQFYIISPLIILPLYHFHLAGVGVLLSFLIAGTVACGILTAKDDLPANIFDGGNSQKFFNEYVKPWNRISPYLIGMYTGYLLYKTECKFRLNKYINLLSWIVFTALACTILYGLHEDVNGHRLSTDVASLYTATHRFVWGTCVCWVIFACATENGGIINTILSWKGFIPLSRLTYCAYLVHPIIIYFFILRRQRPIHFSDTEVVYEFIGHLVLSFGVAFITSLVFESPMMGLEKVLLKRTERKR